MDLQEVAVEMIQGDSYCTITVGIRKYINRINKLKEKYPTLVNIRCINSDGSMLISVPSDWFKFPSPPKSGGRTWTKEQKQENVERLKKWREDKKAKGK